MTGRRWVAAFLLAAALAGCAPGQAGDAAPVDDAAARSVGDARSAMAAAALTVQLQLSGATPVAFAQVALTDALASVADAERELATAEGLAPSRRGLARTSIQPALEELSAVCDAGPANLSPADLAGLEEAERRLAATAAELER